MIAYKVFIWSTRYSCQIFMKLTLSRQILDTQIPNSMKIRLVAAEIYHVDGQKDRPDEVSSRFPQFRERA